MSQPATLADGRYSLTELLGQGGMASVYRCYDHRLRVWRAAKLLEPSLAKRKSIRARFLREAHAMARLEHRNVVRVYDVGADDETPWIIMELAEGGSLVGWIEAHGAMPARLAAEVMIAVCEGVQAAHDEGIVHRDIKPDNVLLDRRGVCKVTDFGIAREIDDLHTTKTGSVMGTWLFMAPEQRTDAKHVDHRADVYALGATLTALVLGDPPADLFAVAQDPSKLDGVPSLLQPVIKRAVAYQPSDRFHSAAEFKEVLSRILPALPIRTDVPSLVVKQIPSQPPPEPHPASVPIVQGPTDVSPNTTGGRSTPPHASGEFQTQTPDYVDREALVQSEQHEQAGGLEEVVGLGGGLSSAEPAEHGVAHEEADAVDGLDHSALGQAGWVLREILDFLFQIAVAIGKMLRGPLGAFLVPLLGVMAIGAVPVGMGTYKLRSASNAAEAARSELLSVVEQEAAVVASLEALQGRHDYLARQLDLMRRTHEIDERLESAVSFVTTVDEDVRRRASRAPAEVKPQAEQARLHRERLNQALDEYNAAMSTWEELAASPSGRAAVVVGFARQP